VKGPAPRDAVVRPGPGGPRVRRRAPIPAPPAGAGRGARWPPGVLLAVRGGAAGRRETSPAV